MSSRQTSTDFVVTKEHRRFAEFCEACRRYRYIGLCYGQPGVDKTLSARHYANWDMIEASIPARNASTTVLTALLESHIVFYTPRVVNTPAQVAHNIGHLRSALRSIRVENRERKQRVHLEKVHKQARAAEEERQRRLFIELDWCTDPRQEALKQPAAQYVRLSMQISPGDPPDRRSDHLGDHR